MAAPEISQTLITTRQRISRRLGDLWTGTATGGSAGSGGTDGTLTATGDLARYPTSPKYFLNHEISITSGTGSGQSRHVTDFSVSSGTATFSVEPWTAPAAASVFELHRKFSKAEYDDAINSAISSLAGTYFTDKYTIPFATQQGTNGVSPRFEYPMPSGYNYLYSVQYLPVAPSVLHPLHYGKGADSAGYNGNATSTYSRAQSFTVPEDGYYEFAAVGLKTIGSPTDTVKVYIYSDSAGLPNALVTNGTSTALSATTLPTSGVAWQYVVFQFPIPPYLDAGTVYHLVVSRTGASDANNYYSVATDPDVNYSGGSASVLNATGPTWSATTDRDICFSLTKASSSWIPIAPKRGGLDGWEYRRIGSDVIFIPNLPREGVPIRIVGFAPLAEISAETDAIPVRPDYVQAKAIMELSLGRSGDQLSDDYGRKASMWAQNLMTQPKPYRHFPPNTVEVFA